MIYEEAGLLQLFKDLNLPYEVYINVQEGGGGASSFRLEPERVGFGIYQAVAQYTIGCLYEGTGVCAHIVRTTPFSHKCSYSELS